ncbi:hypothetical protein HHI36_023691 [Cryptolaemus montrouzieri]|uniref:C2 domain-containing protein 5 n=1 Tax=Cryptolaemus montrouzieri TaxID=559131 RepID=A0ABD2PHK3_9CUCU
MIYFFLCSVHRHYQSCLNFQGFEKSFRLNVEPLNQRLPYPFHSRINLQGSFKRSQSRSLDQPFISKPITLVEGSSLRNLLDEQNPTYTSSSSFSERVRNFRSNFIKDKDMISRKFFGRKLDRGSVMAEMLVRSVLDCHKNLAPLIEHQDSAASDKSTSEKCSSCSDLPGSRNVITDNTSSKSHISDSADFSTHNSISESSSSNDTSDMNNDMIHIVDDTISDIMRNLKLTKKSKYLTRQHSLSLNDLSREYISNFFNAESGGLTDDDPLFDFNMNKYESYSQCISPKQSYILVSPDNLFKAGKLINMKDKSLSHPDKLPSFEKQESCIPKTRSSTAISCATKKIVRQEEVQSYPSSIHHQQCETGTCSHNCGSNAYLSEDPRLILPPIEMKGNIDEKNLFKTAIQTILLEKANIVGTYTPPVSPCRVAKSELCLSESEPIHKSFSFTPSSSPIQHRTKRCKTKKELETVLGIPFQSLSTSVLSKYSNKCLFSSDTELDKPLTELETLKLKVSKSKSCFPSMVHVYKKKTSRKNSLIQKFQYPGLRKLSLFSKKKFGSTLEQQRSFSSDDIPKRSFTSLSKLHHFSKILSHLSLFKEKDKSRTRSQSVFYIDVVDSNTDVIKTPEININEKNNPSLQSAPPRLTSNNSENESPIVINSKCDQSPNNKHASSTLSIRYNSSPLPDSFQAHQHASEIVGTKIQSPAKLTNASSIHRRSSDSDLSITPKGNSLTGSDRSGCMAHGMKSSMILRSMVHQDNFDMLEYPFLTISKYPSGFIQHLGGAVSARSVKLLERISNFEEPETRDTWWSELRMEIRSHARALNCNAVLGYTETSSICEDVCILSSSGTAAVIGFPYGNEVVDTMNASVTKDSSQHEQSEIDKEKSQKDMNLKNQMDTEQDNSFIASNSSCKICHLPYNGNMQIRSSTLKCALCRNAKVPEVLITTIEPPEGTLTIGRGCFLQASVQRPLKDLKGELNAKEISDGLPFLEYELHRILVNRLKIKGMNAVFGLKIRISIGERMLIGLATGTAVFLAPLQSPILPKIISDRNDHDKKLADLQKRLKDTIKKNRELYQLKHVEEIQTSGRVNSDDGCDEEMPNLELSFGNKDCCLLEVDDPDDAEIFNLLIEECPPSGIHVVNTEFVPGLEELEIVKNLQMFKQIYRSKIQYPFSLNQHFLKLLQCIYFKLRKMVPCAVCDLQFRIDVPEADEVQISVLGMALGLGDCQKLESKRKNTSMKHDDLIFNLEEVNIPENGIVDTKTSNIGTPRIKVRQKSPLRNKAHNVKQRHIPYRERHGVDITPLSYIPGGKIERYLGNLNFFFIRETTSLREEGGLNGFVHSFATEVLAIVRAHVTALGGNGMVSYFLTECVLNYNLHKNQGQCLINVGGDVVFVSYYKEE